MYCSIFLSLFSSSLSNAICKIPGVTDFSVNTKLFVATTLVIDAAGWTITNAAINLSNATVSFNNAVSGSSFTNLMIRVRLVRQNDGSEEISYYWIGAYVANYNIGSMSQQVHYTTPMPAYGYTAHLEFLESE